MIAVYAAKNIDTAVRASSSSGGVFRALSEETIRRGGAVYGVRYDAAMRVVHARATSESECKAFSGSKYVQSEIGSSFAEVRADLESGRPVTFSGTPCQVAGLKSYLSVVRAEGELLTVDVICHGVPSPRLWDDHVKLVERRLGSTVVDFSFRDKSAGWRGVHYRAETDQGASSGRVAAAFGDLFNSGNALRPSCHSCPFAAIDRVADLTIGDYWGVERHYPKFDDNMGVSVVLVNTPAGRDAFEAVRAQLECFEISIEDCLQPNLVRPTPPSPRRDAFWRSYQRVGYERALRRYTTYGFVRRNVRRLRAAARRLVR